MKKRNTKKTELYPFWIEIVAKGSLYFSSFHSKNAESPDADLAPSRLRCSKLPQQSAKNR